LFFFLGVVLTVFVMRLFFTPATVVELTDKTENLAKPIYSENKQNYIAKELSSDQTQNSDEDRSQWPVFDPPNEADIIDYMVAHQIESIRAEFSPVVGGDAIKLKLLSELAGEMMRKDALAAIQLKDEISDYVDYTILDVDDAELNQAERANKEKILEYWNKDSEIKEQHRIEYEDAVRNLLTPDEFTKYTNTEVVKAHRQRLAQAIYTAREVKVSLRDLTDYQRSEIDRIANKVAQIGSDSIPIGYSIGGGARSLSLDMADLNKEFQSQLTGVLTNEQIEILKQNPVMNLR